MMDNFNIFEQACKYISEKMCEFKDVLNVKISSLEKAEWSYDKGSIKVCKPDESGRKPRCKAGINYCLKVSLSGDEAEIIWNEFSEFFGKTHISDIERVTGNEELGRYEFIAKNSKGDEILCSIYLPNEWNIPQIGLLGFVSSRYKKTDYVE